MFTIADSTECAIERAISELKRTERELGKLLEQMEQKRRRAEWLTKRVTELKRGIGEGADVVQ
jgi:hypothetical protein